MILYRESIYKHTQISKIISVEKNVWVNKLRMLFDKQEDLEEGNYMLKYLVEFCNDLKKCMLAFFKLCRLDFHYAYVCAWSWTSLWS